MLRKVGEVVQGPNPAESRRYKIYVLGNQAAGKSCLLAGLEIASELDRESDVSVTAVERSRNVLRSLAEFIRDGMFPSSTTSTIMLDTEIRYKNFHLSCSWLDYPGERFMTSFGRGEEDFAREVADIVDGDFFLLALAPEDYAGSVGSTSSKGTDAQDYADRLSAMRSALEQIRRERKSAAPDVAVLLTKADLFSKTPMSPRDAETHLRQNAAVILENLRSIFPNIPVFAVSAVGNCLNTNVDHPQPDKDNLNPWGYEHVFEWMVKRVRRHKHARAMRLLKITAAIGGVLLLAWLSWMQWIQWRSNAELDSIVRGTVANDERVRFKEVFRNASSHKKKNVIDAILQRASENSKSTHVGDLTQAHDELVLVLDVSDGYKVQEANSLAQTLNKLIDEARFKAVESAFTQDSKLFARLAVEYLRDFESGDNRVKVERMLAERERGEQERDLANLMALNVTSSQGLREIAAALNEYLGKYAIPNRDEAKKVVQLALKLADDTDNGNMKIELQTLGELKNKHWLSLRIYIENSAEPVYEHQSGEKVTSFGFDSHKTFSMQWHPNNIISLEVYLDRGMFWPNKRVARKELIGPLSIKDLDSPLELEPEVYADYFDNGKIQLKADVKGWEPADWDLLRAWITERTVLRSTANGQ